MSWPMLLGSLAGVVLLAGTARLLGLGGLPPGVDDEPGSRP